MKGRESAPSSPRARNLGAGKPKEATGAVIRLVPGPAVVLRLVWESLEGRPQQLFEEKPQRGAASERAYGTRRGVRPRRVKPHERIRDGTGPGGHEGSKASRG